ncbi:aldo/keto reductase [Marivita sp.]|uniref:aldo/keto reductase n=1 Tax=Marivita sp. TaxID=2003365 RepID=UPI003A86401F
MKKRRLLQSGKMVSEIGLGCMSFGGFYGATDQTESHATLAAALDLGIDLLDTANVYGLGISETVIGKFLKGDTSKFTIATKAGIWRDKEHGNRGFNNKPDYLRSELEGSLRRMGIDHVDLFYVHRRDRELQIEDVMETLLALKAEGKIGGIGFSEISPASLRRASAVGPVDVVQSEYSLWSRQPDLGMLQTCRDLGVALVAYSPLARGMVSSVTPNPATFLDKDFRKNNPRFLERNFGFNLPYAKAFQAYAQDHGTTATALALAWCLARGENIIPIPGTRTPDHLAECAAASALTVTPDMMAEIEHILPVGWAHGDRYSQAQWNGPEGYC